jgi:class 3 adenylate cyclase
VDLNERSNRTWLCSVVFLDVVEYSKQPVTQQIAMKEYLNQLISHAIEQIATGDRVILDTGDGAALCFLGDPEHALFVALGLRNGLLDGPEPNPQGIALRIGIHLGPVKMVRDINGQLNVIGDGINAAQRVMSFAKPNQILVSRSYYETVAILSQENAKLFHYEGVRKDKHIREYDVYEVGVPSSAHVDTQATAGSGAEAEETIQPITPHRREEQQEAASPGAGILQFDPQVLEAAERDLAEHVGPIARLLVRRAARTASDAQALYRALAEHVSDEKTRQHFLDQGARAATAATYAPTRRPAEEHSSAPGSEPTGTASWDPAVLLAAEEQLATYLGPVAKVLVRRTARSSSSFEELAQKLAQHLDDERQRENFLKAVRTTRK